MQALASKRASAEELTEIRRMLERGKRQAEPRVRFVMNAIEHLLAAAGGAGYRMGAAPVRLAGRR